MVTIEKVAVQNVQTTIDMKRYMWDVWTRIEPPFIAIAQLERPTKSVETVICAGAQRVALVLFLSLYIR